MMTTLFERRSTGRTASADSLGDGMAAETEIVIPPSWMQRYTRAQIGTILGVLLGAAVWAWSVNSDLVTLKERLARTEAKLELMKDDVTKLDKEMSNKLTRVSTMLDSIDQRLSSIDRSVKIMAQ